MSVRTGQYATHAALGWRLSSRSCFRRSSRGLYFVAAGRYSIRCAAIDFPDRQSHSICFPGVWTCFVSARTAANGAAHAQWPIARRSVQRCCRRGRAGVVQIACSRDARFLDGGRLDPRKRSPASASIASGNTPCSGRVLLAVSFAARRVLLAVVRVSPIARARAAVARGDRVGARHSCGITSSCSACFSKARRGSSCCCRSASRSAARFGPGCTTAPAPSSTVAQPLLIDAGIFFGLATSSCEHTFAVAS